MASDPNSTTPHGNELARLAEANMAGRLDGIGRGPMLHRAWVEAQQDGTDVAAVNLAFGAGNDARAAWFLQDATGRVIEVGE